MNVTKFNKGEMYWYINKDSNKENYNVEGFSQDFLSDRPVLIVSQYIDAYKSSVTVIPTSTSSHRTGITITMPDKDGKMEKTKLIPYRMRSVPVQYLKNYIGKLDPNIQIEVDEAIDWHLGRGGVEKPAYVDEEIQNIVQRKNKIDERKNQSNNKKDSKKKKKSKKKQQKKIDKKSQKAISDNVLQKDSSDKCVKVVDQSTISYEPTIIDSSAYRKGCDFGALLPHENICDILFNIYNPPKVIKDIYKKTFNSMKDKFLCLKMDSIDIAKKYKITVHHVLAITKMIHTEFGLRQNNLLRDLSSHTIQLTHMDKDNKYIYMTLSNDDLYKVIKKKSMIQFYRNQYGADLSL